jgi:hypothetical protein
MFRAGVALLLLGCTPLATEVTTVGVVRGEHRRVVSAAPCPDEPRFELVAMHANGTLEGPFGVGGHLETLTLLRDENTTLAFLIGTLDVKGTLAFERRTRALALESYASALRGESPARMVLLRGTNVMGSMEVVTAMRGRRFRIQLTLDASEWNELENTMSFTVREDRRCFAGRY